jgi:hypothetical protein
LLGLALNHDPPDLCLLRSWDYRCEPPVLRTFPFLNHSLLARCDWYTPIIPALRRLSQEDVELEASLVYTRSPLVSKNKQKKAWIKR